MPDGWEQHQFKKKKLAVNTKHIWEPLWKSILNIREWKDSREASSSELVSEPVNTWCKNFEETEFVREPKFFDSSETRIEEQEHNEENKPIKTLHDWRNNKNRGSNPMIENHWTNLKSMWISMENWAIKSNHYR